MIHQRLSHALRHPVTQNAAALYAMTFALTVLPLITFPWIARALGPHEFGVVVFVQSFSFLLGMLVEYGFALSATREIAGQRDDPRTMSRTVQGVQTAKLMLVTVASAGALVAFLVVPQFRGDLHLLAFGWILAVLQGLNPGWFFTGLEWIKLTAATEVAVRLLAAVAVIALVHDRGDGDKVLWIWTAGAGASLAVLTVRMYRVVPLRRPRIADGRRALRHGWALFVANASVSLYTTGTVFMLGLCVASAQLAMFSGAERLVRASLRATSQLAGATYPRVSFLVRSGREDRAHRLAVVALLGMFALASATAVAIIALAPWIVSLLLGPEFSAAVPLLRTLALLLPLVSLNTAFTGQWLMPRGFDGPVTRIVVVAAVANLVLTPAIAQIAGTGGVAWGLVALEAGMAGGMALVMWREGLIAVGNPHPTMQ